VQDSPPAACTIPTAGHPTAVTVASTGKPRIGRVCPPRNHVAARHRPRERRRRQPENPLVMPRQMALVAKTNLDRDVRNPDARTHQQLPRPFHPAARHVLVRRQTGRPPKLAREMERTQRRHPRQVGQRHPVRQILVDVIHHLPQPAPAQSPAQFPARGLPRRILVHQPHRQRVRQRFGAQPAVGAAVHHLRMQPQDQLPNQGVVPQKNRTQRQTPRPSDLRRRRREKRLLERNHQVIPQVRAPNGIRLEGRDDVELPRLNPIAPRRPRDRPFQLRRHLQVQDHQVVQAADVLRLERPRPMPLQPETLPDGRRTAQHRSPRHRRTLLARLEVHHQFLIGFHHTA
jgi:hypothetical protein